MKPTLVPTNGPKNALNLFSISRLEALLCCPIDQIRAIAIKAGSYYSPFLAPPAQRWFPKKPAVTKVRRIDQPIDPLKELQRRILNRLLEPLALPDNMKGGVKGRSLKDNIELHRNARVLVTLDIKSFFPSISNEMVYSIWRSQLNCSPYIAGLLTKLTTFERHLPQGAPTSTYLANLFIASIQDGIVTCCAENNVVFSTWVDDLAFSGDNAPHVIETVVAVLRRAGLAVSHKKLKVMRPGVRKVLNGIVIGKELNVSFKYRKDLRAGIYRLRRGQINRWMLDKYTKSMLGRIAYVLRFNPRLGERFQAEFSTEVQIARKRLGFKTAR